MKRGFTLIEMLVSVALFSMVMVVAIGALLSLSVATRKAEAINATVNNLGAAIDSMSRTIRTGVNYHCGMTGGTLTQDCVSGDTFLEFLAADGTYTAYCYDATTFALYRKTLPPGSPNGNPLFVSCTGAANVAAHGYLALTSPQVQITSFTFFVNGTCALSGSSCTPTPGTPDTQQPLVTMVMTGSFAVTNTQSSQFNLQTTVTQRLEDL